jgi:transcription termination factor Rho
MGAVELACCVALGQRIVIAGPHRSGRTTIARELARAFHAAVPDAHIVAILVDRPVEEAMEWRADVPGVEIHSSSSDDPPEEQADIGDAVAAASATCDAGGDALIIIDSFAALARAINVTREFDERVLTGGLLQHALRDVRGWFAKGRTLADGGSLTLVGTVTTGTESELDEIVFQELTGTGNADIRLDEAMRRNELFPPLDLAGSGARHTELVIGDAETQRRATLRTMLDQLGPGFGLEFLLEQLRPAGTTLDDVLSRATGDDAEQPQPT